MDAVAAALRIVLELKLPAFPCARQTFYPLIDLAEVCESLSHGWRPEDYLNVDVQVPAQ
jgi:hypothetical protein